MDTMFFYTGNFYTFAGAAAVLVLAVYSFLHYQNTNLRTSRYTYSSPALPAGFCGFRLRQVTSSSTNILFRDNGRRIRFSLLKVKALFGE